MSIWKFAVLFATLSNFAWCIHYIGKGQQALAMLMCLGATTGTWSLLLWLNGEPPGLIPATLPPEPTKDPTNNQNA